MICIPIVASTAEEALRDLERAEQTADMTELRLDLLPRDVWATLLQKKKKPCIMTLRPEREGGHFRHDESTRIALFESLLEYNPDFIDLEWDTPPHPMESLLKRKSERTGLIVSYHNMIETPQDLEDVLKRVISRGGDVVKIVTQANDLGDNVRILNLFRKQPGRMIAFCMGPFGTPSRILTLRSGGFLTFGTLTPGKTSAAGQLTAGDLRHVYRAHQIGERTRVFGLIGDPVGHSLSPIIHNAAFQALDLDAVYVPLRVRDVDRLLWILEEIGVEGVSVTIPHKQRIVPLLNDTDEEARRLDAVNTVYRQDGQWLGTNTDADGAWKALGLQGIDHLQHKRWTILGAGGVARAVAYSAGVHGSPMSLTVVGRNQERVMGLLDHVRAIFSFPVSGVIYPGGDVNDLVHATDILVNATPVGMAPAVDETPIPPHLIEPHHVVFDTVYHPMQTRLLREARDRGAKTCSGFWMFLYQGAAQFERWTGQKAPFGLMEQRARERLAS